jgi:hypothetical protein
VKIRRWLLILLFLLGLVRYILYYTNNPFNRWILGPFTHTFSFSSALSEAKLIKVNPAGEAIEYPLRVENWNRDANFGFFVGRAKIAGLIGLMRHQNSDPQVIRLRKLYHCDSNTQRIKLLERRSAQEDFSQLFSVSCD